LSSASAGMFSVEQVSADCAEIGARKLNIKKTAIQILSRIKLEYAL